MPRIYFDNAATTPLSPIVLQAMLPHYTENYGNPSSIHADGRRARTAIEQARKTVANYLNASVGELFFTSGGSEGNNMAIKNAVRDLGVKQIITTKIEHHCVLHAVEAVVRDTGITATYLRVNEVGQIDLSELEACLLQAKNSQIPVLVSLMHANNEIGVIYNLFKISELCQKYTAYFHTDTVQTFGKYPIDLQKIKVHFLTASAHKFHGPKGVGIIYINSDIRVKPYIDGGAQERNMRGGTENVAGIVGFATALTEAIEAMDLRKNYIQDLKNYFVAALRQNFNDIEFNGAIETSESAYHIISLSFPPSMRADMLIFNLDVAGISASGGSACSSGVENASHVMAATRSDSDRRTVRFSLAHYNTPQEIDILIRKLKEIIGV
ncbi:MAG: hypothetical protein RI894_564, partial [Bacteroidota bacterium]